MGRRNFEVTHEVACETKCKRARDTKTTTRGTGVDDFQYLCLSFNFC